MKKAHQSLSLRFVLAGRLATFLLLQAAGQCYNKVNFLSYGSEESKQTAGLIAP